MNQLYVYIHPHISSLLCLPPTLPIPTPLGGHKTRSYLPVLCGCFPLAICFTFGSVYMSMPLSHFVPAYPSQPFLLKDKDPGAQGGCLQTIILHTSDWDRTPDSHSCAPFFTSHLYIIQMAADLRTAKKYCSGYSFFSEENKSEIWKHTKYSGVMFYITHIKKIHIVMTL